MAQSRTALLASSEREGGARSPKGSDLEELLQVWCLRFTLCLCTVSPMRPPDCVAIPEMTRLLVRIAERSTGELLWQRQLTAFHLPVACFPLLSLIRTRLAPVGLDMPGWCRLARNAESRQFWRIQTSSGTAPACRLSTQPH